MDQHDLVNKLFDEAHDLPLEQRAAFLRSKCADPTVVSRVLDLFAGAQAAPTVLKEPVAFVPYPSERPPEIAGFRIIRQLGSGGMGIVYLAEEIELKHRQVALKLIRPELIASEQTRKRFHREAATAARLDHPAIVPVYRYSDREGPQYIAMKFVDGMKLSEYGAALTGAVGSGDITESERERRIGRVVQRIAEALHHAHGLDVVHRDVKPSNILVSSSGEAYLSDFGIAKVADEPALTMSQQNPLTPDYASPEQAERDQAEAARDQAESRINGQSDVFSLGVVLYEALVGVNPFHRDTTVQTLDAIRTFHPPDIRRKKRAIPRRLAKIVRIAIEKDRRFRYPTAAHLATDVGCWLRGEPIFGRDVGWPRRLQRWMYRNRGHAMLLGLGMFAVIALTLAGVVFLQERARTSQVHVRMVSAAPITGKDTYTLWIAKADPATLELGPLEPVGVGFRRTPGLYRLAAQRAPDGLVVETSLVILRAGENLTLDIPMDVEPPGAGMVRFEGGTFDFGSADRRGFQRQREVAIDPFYLDAAEVSNREYDEFVMATGNPLPRHWTSWVDQHPGGADRFDPLLSDRPVVGISWDDAAAYARWCGKRLPTVFEWEYAMRLAASRRQPWGDGVPELFPQVSCEDQHRAGISDKAFQYDAYVKYTHPVRSLPELASPEGLYHGSSNVQEMTESVSVGPTTVRIIKGAGWHQLPQVVTPVETMTLPFESVLSDGTRVRDTSMKVGFRCARSAPPAE